MSAQGWYDRNEMRRYPFADDVTTGFPDDVIADLAVVVPAALLAADVPVLASISAGPSYISFVVRCGATDVAWFGGAPTPHTELALTPLVAGAGGTVVLGRGVETWRGVSALPGVRLAVPTFSAVFDGGCSVSAENDGAVTTFTSALRLLAGPDVVITTHDTYGPYTNVIRLALSPDITPATNEVLVGNCARNVQNRSCVPSAITSINGVRSDGSKITLRFVSTDVALGVVDLGDAVVALRADLTLTRACDDRNTPVTAPGVKRSC